MISRTKEETLSRASPTPFAPASARTVVQNASRLRIIWDRNRPQAYPENVGVHRADSSVERAPPVTDRPTYPQLPLAAAPDGGSVRSATATSPHDPGEHRLTAISNATRAPPEYARSGLADKPRLRRKRRSTGNWNE